MPPGRKAGYDCTYREDVDLASFSEEVVRALSVKGFCAIDDAACRDRVPGVVKEATDLDSRDASQWISTPGELVEGLLGPDGSSRHAIVEPGDSALGSLDARMSTFAGLLNPWAEYLFGCSMTSRSDTFLLETGQATSTFPTPKDAMEWLEILSWQKVLVLFFTGPGSLELTPFDAEAEKVSITTEEGFWILLRADALGHVFKPSSAQSYVLVSFLLQDLHQRSSRGDVPAVKVPAAQQLEERILDSVRLAKESASCEEEFQEAVTRNVQFQANRMFHKGIQVAIRGIAVRAGGCCQTYDEFERVVYSGLDAATDVDKLRWDHKNYFTDDPDTCMEQGKTYSMHSCFYEGVEQFDNKFFGISNSETAAMDPLQRQILEVAYTTMNGAGWTRKMLMKSWTGVAIGAAQGEFSSAPKTGDSAGMASTSTSLAITANRISYIFGLMGPSYGVDMEGAASMVSVGQCADMVQHGKLQSNQSLAGGVEIISAPNPSMYMSWAGMLSLKGRCQSFDENADGFIRGEVTGCVFMNSLMHEIDGSFVIDENPRAQGIISAAVNGHSGKAASMTSPSGSSDIELLETTLRRACLDPLDVDVIECHGLGAILHDAVEEAAIARTYRSSPTDELLACTASKSVFGHSGRGAGIITVMKMLGCGNWGTVSPTVHLSVHNPHVEVPDDSAMFLVTESLQNRLYSTFSAGTCKSWSGMTAHSIFYGVADCQKVQRSGESKEAAQELMFWPGGGGFLDRNQKPLREYAIVGSWSSWKPEGMMNEGKGVFSYTLTLGESGFERFQIFLDGDPERVLHPNCEEGAKDMQVHGPSPSEESFGSCWQIEGRSKLRWQQTDEDGAESLIKFDGPDIGEPGDQYLIKIEVLGKYRMVTWQKIVEQSGGTELPVKGPVPELTYSVIGSFTGWEPQEMTPAIIDNGTQLTCEVQLASQHVDHEFQIIVNGDMRRALYPETAFSTAGPAFGPDELGMGYTWQLTGRAGETYKIVMERTVRSGVMVSKVYWERIGIIQVPERKPARYYVVGSWDGWRKPIPMLPTGTGTHVITRHLPEEGSESFQIMKEGYAGLIYPSIDNACPSIHHSIQGPMQQGSHIIQSPGSEFLSWTVGEHPADRHLKGGSYKIILAVTVRGTPKSVTWQSVQALEDVPVSLQMLM